MIEIREEDFRQVLSDILPSSAALVLTDPLWNSPWEELGAFAAKVLKPGSLLVTYTGRFELPSVMESLAVNLDYVTLGIIKSLPPPHMGFKHKIISRIQVLLFYSNGKYQPQRWTYDYYERVKVERKFSKFQKSSAEVSFFLDRLSSPGELVIDPFCGGGAVAEACKKLGRDFLGCDLNPEAVQFSRERVK